VTDARLLVPAGGAWLGAAVATWAMSPSATMSERHETASRLLLACVLGAGTVLAMCAVPAVRRMHGQAPAILVAGLCLLLGAGSAALGAAVSTAAPLGAWVDAGATAVIRGEVAAEPEVRAVGPARAWQPATRSEVQLDAQRVSARGESIEVAVPVVLRLAPATPVPPPGTSVEVTGRLRAIPPRLGAVAALTLAGGSGIRVREGPGVVDRVAQSMRSGLRRSLGGVAARSGSLVAGLAVGDDSAQPPALAVAMRDSGLSHLTAVSGGIAGEQ
jgi:competence protein ComEC